MVILKEFARVSEASEKAVVSEFGLNKADVLKVLKKLAIAELSESGETKTEEPKKRVYNRRTPKADAAGETEEKKPKRKYTRRTTVKAGKKAGKTTETTTVEVNPEA